MKITKLLLLEVGTYNDQYQRPYTSHVDGGLMQELQEATNMGRNLTPAALGAVGSDIMRLSTTTAGTVSLANGFDTPRLCFMMEVEFPGQGGVTGVEWMLGFTDHIGVSAQYGDSNPVFDPNMRLFFNNVMQGRRVRSGNAYGAGLHTTANRAYQLINAEYKPQINNLHSAPHLMRPQDVFTSMSMQGTRSLLGDEAVMDVRPTHGPEKVAVSHRRNSVPGQYLSAMLTTWKTQTELDEVDPAALNSQMAASVAEPTIARLRSLNYLATMSELRQGGSVSWNELMDADETGTAAQRAVIVLAQSQRTRSMLSQRGGDSANWNGNGSRTLVAASFVQAVPGIMMNLLLTDLQFSVTNRTLDGSWEMMFERVESFNESDNINQLEAFRHKVCQELMPGLSHNGALVMEIRADFSVMGQTFVEIAMDDGEGFYPFMAPSFCDGLFAPVRAPDATTLDRFADNLSKITSNLEQDYSAGGYGYEPHDQQFSSILNAQGNKYENSGPL